MTPEATIDIARSGSSSLVSQRLLQSGFDPGVLRPFEHEGHNLVTNRKNETMVTNAPALLRKDEWEQLDNAVVNGARNRLKLISDLRSSGLTHDVSAGIGKTTLVTQKASEITEAEVSMHPTTQADSDNQEFDTDTLPLPVVSKDFSIPIRLLESSRIDGTPLDVSQAEQCGRRVSEMIEQIGCGKVAPSYGGNTVYGITNFPDRNTQTLDDPNGGGWTPAATVQDVLQMKNASQLDGHYGPWKLYNGAGWDVFLDDDYSAAKGDNTLRQRLLAIEGIQSMDTLDYLGQYEMVLVQQTSDVIRLVDVVDVTTVQWETMGGLMLHMKVMAVLVPQLRAEYEGKCGLVHGNI